MKSHWDTFISLDNYHKEWLLTTRLKVVCHVGSSQNFNFFKKRESHVQFCEGEGVLLFLRT